MSAGGRDVWEPPGIFCVYMGREAKIKYFLKWGNSLAFLKKIAILIFDCCGEAALEEKT